MGPYGCSCLKSMRDHKARETSCKTRVLAATTLQMQEIEPFQCHVKICIPHAAGPHASSCFLSLLLFAKSWHWRQVAGERRLYAQYVALELDKS